MGLLGEPAGKPDSLARCAELRSAMLDLVFETVNAEAPYTAIFLKLHQAREVQTLWYLRSDLMMFLSEHVGEAEAMRKLQPVTALFDGAVPRQHMLSAQRRR
jgi:hypothetical protein